MDIREPVVAKSDLRRRLRAARRSRSPGDPQALCRQLVAGLAEFGVGQGADLAGFLPAHGEPDVSGCLRAAHQRGGRVLVPRTLPEHGLEWVAWTPEVPLAADRHGLLAPIGPAVAAGLAGVGAVLVPALAADRAGRRLGHGAGYYDRALAPVPRWPAGPVRAAVVHPEELLPEPLPAEPHDEAVDLVVTGAGWVRADPGQWRA